VDNERATERLASKRLWVAFEARVKMMNEKPLIRVTEEGENIAALHRPLSKLF
jgi:hypothetical protein